MRNRWLLRIGQTLLSIWILASLTFLLSHSDPVGANDLVLLTTTDVGSTRSTAAEQRTAQHAINQRLGLNAPLFYFTRVSSAGSVQWYWHGIPNQYHSWLLQTSCGSLGTSLRTGQPVVERLRNALAHTLPLLSVAFGLSLGGAWWLAVRLAARPWWRTLSIGLLSVGQALPLFVLALGLLLLFANPELLEWFPIYAIEPAATASWSTRGVAYFHQLVLPLASLVGSAVPPLALQLEAALLAELQQPYSLTARAKGLSIQNVIRHHALRNALLPAFTQLADLLPALVGGAVVVEVIFAVPGMGRLLAEAATTRDYPVLVGGIWLVGTVRLLALLAADILYTWADPRLR